MESGERSHPDCSGIQCAAIDQRACRRSNRIHVRRFPQLPRRESRGVLPGNRPLYAHKPTDARRNRQPPFRSETPIVLIRRAEPRSVVPQQKAAHLYAHKHITQRREAHPEQHSPLMVRRTTSSICFREAANPLEIPRSRANLPAQTPDADWLQYGALPSRLE